VTRALKPRALGGDEYKALGGRRQMHEAVCRRALGHDGGIEAAFGHRGGEGVVRAGCPMNWSKTVGSRRPRS